MAAITFKGQRMILEKGLPKGCWWHGAWSEARDSSQRQRHLAARREAAPIAQRRSGLVGHPDTRAERVGLWNTFFSLDFLAFL